MENKAFRVLGSSSLGFQLYDLETGAIDFKPHRRGKLAHKDKKILIGDFVVLDREEMIADVLPRKNEMKRPRLANVDVAYVLISAKEPLFSSFLLDKFLTAIHEAKISAKIVITKADLLNREELEKMREVQSRYQRLNFETFLVNTKDVNAYDYQKFLNSLKGLTVAFVGQTGVGKSSIINAIDPDYKRKVDSLYVNSGRGRHTTKEIVLFPYKEGFLFDTPGFSELELKDMKTLELAEHFPGYGEYFGTCMFKDCKHLPNSKGCKVTELVENAELSEESYRNYLKIYEEVKENDLWKKKL